MNGRNGPVWRWPQEKPEPQRARRRAAEDAEEGGAVHDPAKLL
jgi:hypothetical protein